MTQDIHENKIPPETTNEINLADLIRQSWLKRRFILKVTGIFLLIVVQQQYTLFLFHSK